MQANEHQNNNYNNNSFVYLLKKHQKRKHAKNNWLLQFFQFFKLLVAPTGN